MDSNAQREKQDLLTWLSALTFWARQQDISKTRAPETGLWLFDDPIYQGWLRGQDQVLWCYGMRKQISSNRRGLPNLRQRVQANPYLRKRNYFHLLSDTAHHLLRSLVVEELDKLTQAHQGTVLFVYCDYKQSAQQTPINLLSSLVRQFATSQSIGLEEVRALRKVHEEKETRPSRPEIVQLLKLYNDLPSDVFVVVDALDECNPTDDTKTLLVEEIPRILSNARFLFTSRKLGDIEKLFDGRLRLEIRARDSDIERSIANRVTHERRLRKRMAADPSLLRLVTDTIVRRSDGMFLLAQLHLSALATKHTTKALRASIEDLPVQIEQTYDNTMRRIEDQSQDDASLAKKVLMWVVHTLRPLTLAELQHALAAMDLKGETDITDEDLPDEDIVISVCEGLVILDEQSGEVRLVHYTAQDFFDRNPLVLIGIAQALLMSTCIAYLSLEHFKKGVCKDEASLRHRLTKYAFTRYAASNWGHHARGQPEADHSKLIMAFLSDLSLRAAHVQAAMFRSNQLKNEQVIKYRLYERPALLCAASSDLTRIVSDYIANGAEVNAECENSKTALHVAAESGHYSTVEILLQAGAKIDTKDHFDDALTYAAVKGHQDVVELLFGKGASMRSPDDYEDLFQVLVTKGHTTMVQFLLSLGARVRDGFLLSTEAIYRGYVEMAESILKSMTKVQRSCLLTTQEINGLDATAVDFLISEGADPYAMNEDGEMAIHIAARLNAVPVVKSLLALGVSPDLRSRNGNTVLHWAAYEGRQLTVEILLNHGADILAKNNEGRSVLMTCLQYTYHGHLVSFMLRYGLAVNEVDSEGRTALHEAARRGYSTAIPVLLESGADASVQSRTGWTPMEEAAASGEEIILQLLQAHTSYQSAHVDFLLSGARLRESLRAGDYATTHNLLQDLSIDVGISNREGMTALHHAASNGQTEIAEVLLQRGASVDSRIVNSAYAPRTSAQICYCDLAGGAYEGAWFTPLHMAAGNGHAEVAALLIGNGADIHAASSKGYTAFGLAARGGYAPVVKMLLDHGCLASGADRPEEGTHLCLAVQRGHKDVVELLLMHGADTERDTRWGKAALTPTLKYPPHKRARAPAPRSADIDRLLRKHGFKSPQEWKDEEEEEGGRGRKRQRVS
ncbi:MAG: hypothetical protein Q9174_003806 [Haloplaca sp. 1 TL-2023]